MNIARMIATGVLGGNPLAYRNSWLHTIYVAPTGNDTTGNGTKAAPYLTLTKAMTAAVAGDGILLADGTYAENTAGLGYWSVAKNVANWLYIEPEVLPGGDVTIVGTGANAINVYFTGGASSHLKFRYLKFTNANGTDTIIRMNTASDNIEFYHCEFVAAFLCAYGFYGTSYSATNFVFDGCTFTSAVASAYRAIKISVNNTVTGWEIKNSTVNGSATGKGIEVTGNGVGGSVNITNCVLGGKFPIEVTTGGDINFVSCTLNVGDGGSSYVGADAIESVADTTVATLTNCLINKDTGQIGHALLFGAGCKAGCFADNVRVPAAYDYALVVKENAAGVEIKNCNLVSGSQAALFFKATTAANAHDNILTAASGYGFRLTDGDGGRNCADWIMQNNTINTSGTGKALDIYGDDDDDGGGVCDYNTYQNNSGLGHVRTDADVQSLTELQAAWADYDVTTNDANSIVV